MSPFSKNHTTLSILSLPLPAQTENFETQKNTSILSSLFFSHATPHSGTRCNQPHRELPCRHRRLHRQVVEIFEATKIELNKRAEWS
ncbi:hypothetical protein AAHA92_09939 [Salvia divinorum]|uniref:Uncharacterized protein n=1 Tax=Salvia divinorum TaxID=28513 RepID=A0ABD1HWG9_SALDI